MTTATGIAPDDALLGKWARLTDSESGVCLLQVAIEGASLVAREQSEAHDCLEAAVPLMKSGTACYLMLKPQRDWLFVSFVAEDASVRDRMLYAATRAAVYRSFGGEGRFANSLFVTKPDELREMVNAPRTTAAESQPLTEREKEKEAVRAAERSAADAPAPKSMYQSGDQQFKGTEWSDEAKAAVADFQGLLQLEIDTAKELVTVSSPQPSTLSPPRDSASYTFYRHSSGKTVFVYCCPSTAPVRSRMIYSSTAQGCVFVASKLHGLHVDKKIESSDPDEVTDQFVADELGLSTGAMPAGTAGSFSKPKGPPRRKR